MSLLNEIRLVLAHSLPETVVKLEGLPDDAPGWIIRENKKSVSAFIPVDDDVVFCEGFSKVEMWTGRRIIDGVSCSVLNLECEDYVDREAFASICEEFLRTESRAGLRARPGEWWARWRDLMGNAFRHQMPHAVLGELMVVKDLLTAGIQAEWRGPASASHDIVTPAFDVEVKSTLKRYGSTVAISGQHQLSPAGQRPLFLSFVRMEPHPEGFSINSVAEQIKVLGYCGHELENSLAGLGFSLGRIARCESFVLKETQIYPVDDNFPKITPLSFKGEVVPAGVLRLRYEVDLSTLNGAVLVDFLNVRGGDPVSFSR